MSLIIQDIVSSLGPEEEDEGDFPLNNGDTTEGEDEDRSTSRAPEIAPIHAISLASNLFNLYNQGIATDIQVNCENEIFKLHSAVLIHGSQYFKTILDCQENDDTSSSKNKEIHLDFTPSIQPHIFRSIVESLYTGIVRKMNSNNISSLLEASYHLNVQHSYDACVNYMMENIDFDNCLEYWLTAKLCKSTKVQNKAIGLIGRHLDLFVSTEHFLGLQPTTIVEILKGDNLLVSNEKKVYEAAMAWIKYDEEQRVGELSSLLDTVRLTYLPVFYLVNVVGKEDLIENDPAAMSKYSKALKLKLANSHGGVKRRHNPVHGAWGNVERMKKKSEVVRAGGCPKMIDRVSLLKTGTVDRNYEDREDVNISETSFGHAEELSAPTKSFLENLFPKKETNHESNSIEGCEGSSKHAQEERTSFLEKLFPKKESNDESTRESLPSIVDDTDTDTDENDGYTDSIIGQRFTFANEPLENVPEASDEDLSEIQSKSDSKTGLSFSEEVSKSNEEAILIVDDDSFDA